MPGKVVCVLSISAVRGLPATARNVRSRPAATDLPDSVPLLGLTHIVLHRRRELKVRNSNEKRSNDENLDS